MMVPEWKVVFFLVVVSWAAAEVEEAVEDEAVGEQKKDPEEVFEAEAHPGMEDPGVVGRPGM